MIVHHCILIHAANLLCLARGDPNAFSSYAFPAQLTDVFMWMQLVILCMTGRMKLIISGSTSGFHYISVTIENERTQRQITQLSQLQFLLTRYTLRNTHTHTRTAIHGNFYSSGVIICTLLCDIFSYYYFLVIFPNHNMQSFLTFLNKDLRALIFS